ncbi:hypothetical protein L1987_06477 [Smallanthus sonchifolius]|uniref:Uncharacterized protein n=1 Tax=Smallanthus sonchifolius TaxID=185202 RepID=A0ACB9JYD5_9ASTR|nr:hypothetical protein L1987_06477 [Smallanthus sonchifolius]
MAVVMDFKVIAVVDGYMEDFNHRALNMAIRPNHGNLNKGQNPNLANWGMNEATTTTFHSGQYDSHIMSLGQESPRSTNVGQGQINSNMGFRYDRPNVHLENNLGYTTGPDGILGPSP